MQFARCLLFAVCLLGGCARRAGEPWTGGPVPERITPGFIVLNFPNCTDHCAAGSTELWLRIRDRPDLLRALIHLVESPATDESTRANAVLRIGSTGQEQGYRYLVRLLSLPPRDADWRTTVIIALSAGNRPLPGFVYATLEQLLYAPYPRSYDPVIAAKSLAGIGTTQARAALERRLQAPGAGELHGIIRGLIQHWRAEPGREGEARTG